MVFIMVHHLVLDARVKPLICFTHNCWSPIEMGCELIEFPKWVEARKAWHGEESQCRLQLPQPVERGQNLFPTRDGTGPSEILVGWSPSDSAWLEPSQGSL